MGGGDLNSKKSWHPSTMKNQERVWKAEQAADKEKKRILELQLEQAEERDHKELSEMVKLSAGATSANDRRLSWMYEKPDKKVQQEDYLLGKAIDTNFDQTEKFEQGAIPAVSRRVVGASMLAAAGDVQVDLARKLREDPLVLVKERERAARAALLNNPLQRHRLAELLRKEQEQRKGHKLKNKSKSKEKDLDTILVNKLNALGGEKGINIATLLASEDSTCSSSSEDVQRKKKKKKHRKSNEKSKKSKKRKRHTSPDTNKEIAPKVSRKNYEVASKEAPHFSSQDKIITNERQSRKEINETIPDKKKRGSHEKNISGNISKDNLIKEKSLSRRRRDSSNEEESKFEPPQRKTSLGSEQSYRRQPVRDKLEEHRHRPKTLSEAERLARLKEMAAAGAEREQERGHRIARQREQDEQAERARAGANVGGRGHVHEARALPQSLESRIHSNRHYIQRDRRHMDAHFARR